MPTPSPDCTTPFCTNSSCIPVNQAKNPTAMNRPILTFFTGTPTARAAAASPPTAKIQLPICVFSSTQAAIATNTIHQTIRILIVTPPSLNSDAKIAFAAPNPSMSLIEFDATAPEASRVTAMFRPCRMKKVPSVTRKLGSPVRISSQPLNAPIASESASATITPSQTFTLNW